MGSIQEEMAICYYIATAAPASGYTSFLRLPIDRFDLDSPSGNHPCLVYIPMRGSLGTFQQHYKELMPFLTPMLAVRLLSAVYYLHGACGLVHTGTDYQYSPGHEINRV